MRYIGLITILIMFGCSGSDSKKLGLGDDLVLKINPSYVTFGTVVIGSEQKRTVELKHEGTSGTIKIWDINRGTGTSEEFSFDPLEKKSLEPGESVILTIWYRPKDEIQDSGTLVIKHNVASQGNTSIIQLNALPQTADLIVEPNPIDFGDISVGDTKHLDVLLKNKGSHSVTVSQIYLKSDGSDDFKIIHINLEENESLPKELAPTTGEIGLVMSYTPTDSGQDHSYLVVVTGEKQYMFEVLGNGLAPNAVIAPGVLDFGWVALGQKKQLDLTITNEGNTDLVIDEGGLAVVQGSDPELKIVGAPIPKVILKPGENKVYQVEWTAKQVQPVTGDPIGSIALTSNDPQSPEVVTVYGRVDAPQIGVYPPDYIDFGFVAKDHQAQQDLTIRNEGHGVLEVSKIYIKDETPDTLQGEFSVAKSGPFSLEEGKAEMVTVFFKNMKGPMGSAGATLYIESNSPGMEVYQVKLIGKRADKAECKIGLSPAILNFGTVAQGFYKELTTNIINLGTGDCTFIDARAEDCMGFGPMVTCQEPFKGTQSKIFKLMNYPAKIPNGIKPGMKVPITIRYTPSPTNPLFGALNQFAGVLGVKVKDLANNVEIVVPQIQGSLGYVQPNLIGQTGIAKVAVLPGEVKFGVVTIGCYSKTYNVCVYNTGNAPLTVTDISLEGCSPEFKLKGDVALPKDVLAGVPVCFQTVYVPKDAGNDGCALVIKSSDQTSPVLSVGLSGTGTFDDEQIDEFVQVTGQNVDVLFVIDDSGSMCEEQDRLIDNYNTFISKAKVWQNDYHIGIISLNVVKEAVMGKLNLGDPKKMPRFITPSTPNGQQKFKEFADLGCSGGSDPQESGLQAAQLALSAPLSTDTGIPCKTDADCQNDKNLCADPKKCPLYCLEGTCGGWNKGFLREDAQLEIIVLSDEEDQSPAAPGFYVDFFKSIKGFYNVGMMHFNAIVGPKGGCTAPDGGTAEEGKRYNYVADETGGKKGSICDSDYGPIMNEIGAQAFDLKVQFFLTRIADPPTIKVWVNGKECKQPAWKYDQPSNSIIFDKSGACMPQPGDKIKVYYKVLCLKQ